MSKRKSRTNLAKFDAHVITQDEYDEAPEWTDDQFDRAQIAIGDTIIRPANGTLTKPGRPKKPDAKKSVHLRLAPDILLYYRATGPGWQTRMEEALRKGAKLPAKKAVTPRR